MLNRTNTTNPALLNALNKVIATLNDYIANNRKKLANINHPRYWEVRSLIDAVYKMNHIRISVFRLDSPTDAFVLPNMQAMDEKEIKNAFIIIDWVFAELKTDWFGRSELKTKVLPTLLHFKQILQSLHNYTDNKENNAFCKLPPELLIAILNLLDETNFKQIAGVSKVFAEYIEHYYHNLIKLHYTLQEHNVLHCQNPQETQRAFYQRLSTTAQLQRRITQLERIRGQHRVEQSSEEALVQGLERGVERLEQHLKELESDPKPSTLLVGLDEMDASAPFRLWPHW